MKKILLAAAFFAVASFNAFAVPCISSGTLAQFAANGACTVGATEQWQLSNFSVFAQDSINFGSNITANDLVLTLADVGSNGFSTTYSIANGSTNFMQVNPTPAPAQYVTWGNGIWITGLAGDTSDDIVSITNTLNGTFGGANVTLRKVVQSQAGGTLSVPTTCYNCQNPLLTHTINQAYGDLLSVNDRPVLDAGGAGTTGGLTSYTNIYLAAEQTGGIPEPMTFVLMGAGLVGIAALRRRKS
jgi:hypothetical protein